LPADPSKPLVPDRRDFSLDVERRAAEVMVAVAGEVDLANGPELEQALVAAVAGTERLVVDLSRCTFLSSTGLRALLQAEKARSEGAPRIVVVAPDPHVRKVFEIAGVASVFELVDRREDDDLESDSRAAL
jgi:anti-anti-sigma factor